MASNAHYRYSAAVEYAASQWESVAKRAYYIMQEDGSVALVDLTKTMTLKVEIRTASEPNKDQIKSSRQSYFDEKLKVDLDDFDDMVTELNKQEAPIKNSQLIDALFISLRLRKHITNPNDGEKNVDVAHYDRMVAQFNEQEKPFSNSQLIAVFSASLKLRQYVKKFATSSTTNQSFNDELTDVSAAALEQKTTVDKSENLLTEANQCSLAAVDCIDRKCDKLLNIDMDFKKTEDDAIVL